MALGGGTRLDRRRRGQWRGPLARLLAHGAVLALVAWWAYDMGGERARSRAGTMEERMNAIAEENRRLTEEAVAAGEARARADRRLAEIRRRYREDAPTGAERDIMTAVRGRIADGVAPERLARVVEAAQPDPRCAGAVTTRRFIVQTPVSPRGANASVSFAGNAIVVTGTGASARSASGAPEAWFDPAAPVRIAFARPGGAASAAEGRLPLHHTVVVGDKAHNFTVTGARTQGFVNVAEQVCDYP